MQVNAPFGTIVLIFYAYFSLFFPKSASHPDWWNAFRRWEADKVLFYCLRRQPWLNILTA